MPSLANIEAAMTDGGTDSVKVHVFWSIYVRAGKRKIISHHLPAISAALEHLEFEWELSREDTAPGLIRLVNFQNLDGEATADVIVPVLRRAYALSDRWWIQGLGDLGAKEVTHVAGGFRDEAVTRNPIVSAMFEIEPGQIVGRDGTGGWKVAGSH